MFAILGQRMFLRSSQFRISAITFLVSIAILYNPHSHVFVGKSIFQRPLLSVVVCKHFSLSIEGALDWFFEIVERKSNK